MIKTKSVQATPSSARFFIYLFSFYLILHLSYSHAPNLALGNGAAK